MTREEIKEYFISEYEKHKHIHNLIVNWDHCKLTCSRLATILYCCGPKLVCMFFKYLAIDYKAWSYGMPDLVLWRESEQKVKFVEVKSEADVLTD